MGRNAAQLRAAAIATGLFDGPVRQYVGDGYTIPFQVSAGPIPDAFFSMNAYKTHLDKSWIEFSRLHDWLYTPYSGLINATQQEADDALQEELMTVSPLDAVIVGNACRYFGKPYFGVSDVGYGGENGIIAAHNIGLAPQGILKLGATAMSTKIVILFQQTSVPNRKSDPLNYDPPARTGGWSESFYGPDDIATVISLLKTPGAGRPFSLLQARANLLNAQANIVGARLYPLGSGKAQILGVSLKGTNGACDSPDNAVQVSALSSVSGQSRRWTLRGMPDNDKYLGEWDPDEDDVTRMQQYFAALDGFGWNAMVETSKVKLFSNTAAGVFTVDGTMPFALTDIVTLKNVYLTDQERRYGTKIVVSATAAPNKFTADAWNGEPGKGGTASKVTAGFQAFATSTKSVQRAVSRKVGRPFSAYRGRKSRKRKPVA